MNYLHTYIYRKKNMKKTLLCQFPLQKYTPKTKLNVPVVHSHKQLFSFHFCGKKASPFQIQKKNHLLPCSIFFSSDIHYILYLYISTYLLSLLFSYIFWKLQVNTSTRMVSCSGFYQTKGFLTKAFLATDSSSHFQHSILFIYSFSRVSLDFHETRYKLFTCAMHYVWFFMPLQGIQEQEQSLLFLISL